MGCGKHCAASSARDIGDARMTTFIHIGDAAAAVLEKIGGGK